LCLIALVVADDKVTSLPGLKDTVKFNHYAGYINVDATAGRALFYWFTESENKPSTDPFVVWQTGGPGCSSLLAMFTENGPFLPEKDGTLSLNPYSWNKKANVLWVESPAGVGFSYSNKSSDYTTVGDQRAAADVYQLLVGFYAMYPQFKNNPLWLSGESYGGHYVPNLAKKIVDENDKGSPKMNIKGFFVGNAWTNMLIDNTGAIDTWWQRGIVPESTVDQIKQYCNLSNFGPLTHRDNNCNEATTLAGNQMGDISIYNIYADVCVSSVAQHFIKQLANSGSIVHQILQNKVEEKVEEELEEGFDPCRDQYLAAYLSRKDVQTAIHVNSPGSMKWSECSGKVHYSYSDLGSSMIPVYKYLIKKNTLSMMVYSGDTDAIVPYLGSINWINSLNLPIKETWRQWKDSSKQVGGYITVYDGLYFSTVRGAGHEVPTYQPDRAFILFNDFINGKLPN